MNQQGWAASIVLLFLLAGCSQQQDPAHIQEAQAAYQTALEAEQAGDFSTARDLYRRAVERGGLQVDEFVESQVRLALCEARLENFDEAHRVLDKLAEGAPDMGRVHAARAFALRKQQRPEEARIEEERARKVNPRVELIKE